MGRYRLYFDTEMYLLCIVNILSLCIFSSCSFCNILYYIYSFPVFNILMFFFKTHLVLITVRLSFEMAQRLTMNISKLGT